MGNGVSEEVVDPSGAGVVTVTDVDQQVGQRRIQAGKGQLRGDGDAYYQPTTIRNGDSEVEGTDVVIHHTDNL